MLETDAHKAFRKKLESLTIKYEKEFPFAKCIRGVGYWKHGGPGSNIVWLRTTRALFEDFGFDEQWIDVTSDADVKYFNVALTPTFAMAYLTHRMRGSGTQLNWDYELKIAFRREPDMYFRPNYPREMNLDVIIPDPEQSWIKYFEELQVKCEALYGQLVGKGGIIAVETNA